ncbi:DUF6455 family protein [Heliomarina baculiformis]|uniref:DUF6455 family protein n=1 Tax=Heliomarina baculiformis TaxID=2872036 RepID=UPI001EE36913|nr:DUF6455 family protein [Heliomarina baculiformis]
MQDPEKLKKHAVLMDRMAETVGVDIQQEILDGGRLTVSELGDAVLRCCECSDPGFCGSWLDAQKTGAMQTPSFCRNSEMMARLRVE